MPVTLRTAARFVPGAQPYSFVPVSARSSSFEAPFILLPLDSRVVTISLTSSNANLRNDMFQRSRPRRRPGRSGGQAMPASASSRLALSRVRRVVILLDDMTVIRSAATMPSMTRTAFR